MWRCGRSGFGWSVRGLDSRCRRWRRTCSRSRTRLWRRRGSVEDIEKVVAVTGSRSRSLRWWAGNDRWSRCCGGRLLRRCLRDRWRFAKECQKLVTFAIAVTIGSAVRVSVGGSGIRVTSILPLQQMRLECLLRRLGGRRARLDTRGTRPGEDGHGNRWLAGFRLRLTCW